MPPKKFYAVANGRSTGIFQDWDTTSGSVTGYSGAQFKGFNSQSEAQSWLASQGGNSSSSGSYSTSSSSGGYHSSPSYNYSSSESSSSYSSSSPSYGYGYSAPSTSYSKPKSSSTSYASSSSGSSSSSRTSPTPKNSSRSPGYNASTRQDPYSPPFVSSSSSWDSPTTSTAKTSNAPRSKSIVYADGACKNNGKGGSAYAGVGVYFGPNDARNVSEPLSGTKQTNQRAELTAALKAMQGVHPAEPLEIRSDSKYVVDGMNSWIHSWGDNDAKWAKVENSDLFKELKSELGKRSADTSFVHVPAHSGIHGNEEADRLAVAGAVRSSYGGK